jgi:hypothetical protein
MPGAQVRSPRVGRAGGGDAGSAVILADMNRSAAWIAIVLISLASVGVALLSKPDG